MRIQTGRLSGLRRVVVAAAIAQEYGFTDILIGDGLRNR